MGHIRQRVFDLPFGQGAARPIGKSLRFIKLGIRQFGHQRLVAHLITKAADHRGNLCIEDGNGQGTAFM